MLLGVATHSLVCQPLGERWAHIHQGGMTLHSTQKSKWPTFRWLGVGFISYLIVWNCQFCTARILSIHITQGEWLYQDYPHICYTLRQSYPSYILSSSTQYLPNSSLVISVPIQVPIVLCSFPWEVMNKCLFTLDRALMTDQTNNSTLV